MAMLDEEPAPAPVVLLSAGSEVTTVALVEELREAGAKIVLASFGQRSLFAGSPHIKAYVEIAWPDDPRRAAEAVLAFTRPLAAASQAKLVAFATDDAVLRMLHEYRADLEETLCVPRAAGLSRGGLDKAELADFLIQQGLGDLVPATVVLDAASELERAIEKLGPELVVKPAHKPYRADLALDATGRKLLASWEYRSSADFCRALERNWAFSDRWIAQARLHPPRDGEVVLWIVRSDSGDMVAISAEARWKHPTVGGTACHVETRANPEAERVGRRLAEAIDLRGLAEFEFMLDPSGGLRMLDCNVRPWLQVGLARAAGLPVAALTWQSLSGRRALPVGFKSNGGTYSWIMIERLLLSVLAGSAGARLPAMIRVLGLTYRADYVAVHGTTLSGVRRAWAVRMLGAVARGMRRSVVGRRA
jgi:D-aspartate ligase